MGWATALVAGSGVRVGTGLTVGGLEELVAGSGVRVGTGLTVGGLEELLAGSGVRVGTGLTVGGLEELVALVHMVSKIMQVPRIVTTSRMRCRVGIVEVVIGTPLLLAVSVSISRGPRENAERQGHHDHQNAGVPVHASPPTRDLVDWSLEGLHCAPNTKEVHSTLPHHGHHFLLLLFQEPYWRVVKLALEHVMDTEAPCVRPIREQGDLPAKYL